MRSSRLWLFFLALALGVALKLTVHEGEQTSVLTIQNVGVQTTIPDGFLVINPENEVQVQVRGKISDMQDLNPASVRVVADVQATAPGIVEVPLGPQHVTIGDDFEVLLIDPNTLVLEVDREVTKVLPILVETTGEPAAGAQVGPLVVRPPTVAVTGPESLLRNVNDLRANVSVDRRAISFEERVTPIMPQPVRLSEPTPIIVVVTMKAPGLSTDDPVAETRPATAG